MPIIAGTLLTELRTALLNDPNAAIYPDATMYPLMNKVYRELQTKISAHGIGTSKEISTTIDVPANTVRLAEGALLPADLLYPTWIGERADGSTGRFFDMEETDKEPDVTPGTELIYWSWREDEIKFVGATTAREIQIRYVKGLGSISGTNSVIAVLGSESWLEHRTAILAAKTIGANPTRAAELEADLPEIWSDTLATMIKRKQAIPVRRRRTRFRIM